LAWLASFIDFAHYLFSISSFITPLFYFDTPFSDIWYFHFIIDFYIIIDYFIMPFHFHFRLLVSDYWFIILPFLITYRFFSLLFDIFSASDYYFSSFCWYFLLHYFLWLFSHWLIMACISLPIFITFIYIIIDYYFI